MFWRHWGTNQVHRSELMFSVLFCFEKISWNKTKPNDVSETFRIYVSTLASRKGGWCGFRLAFSARVTHPESGFLPSLFSFWNNGCLVQGLSLPLYTSLQTHCESSDQPNPPVVQKRDPLACPRFAVEKGVCVAVCSERVNFSDRDCTRFQFEVFGNEKRSLANVFSTLRMR
jgi:hypothetical protein